MKSNLKEFLICLFLINLSLILNPPPSFSQDETEEKSRDLRENKTETSVLKFQTPEDFIQSLKERAKVTLKRKKRAKLLKTSASYSQFAGYETNVNADAETKGDWFTEEDLYLDWLPTINNHLEADIYYWLIKQDYFELSDSSSFDNTLGGRLKIYPGKSKKLSLEPGIEREILRYYRSQEISYNATHMYLNFKYYLSKLWTLGGGYEFTFKEYDQTYARDGNKTPMDGFFRQADKHQIKLYVQRRFGKLGIRLEGRLYKENDNDAYLDYYDRDGWRAKFTFSRAFLKNDKLYLSLSPYFERKNYDHRTVVGPNVARYDNIFNCTFSAIYSLSKHFSLTPRLTYRLQKSNYDLGRYKDIIAQMGVTYDF